MNCTPLVVFTYRGIITLQALHMHTYSPQGNTNCCTADCSGVRLAAEEQNEVVTWSLNAVIVPRQVPCIRLALCSSIHCLGSCFGRPVSQRSLSRQSARCLSQGMLCDSHAPVVDELRLNVPAAGCDLVQWLDKAVYRKCDTEQYIAWDGFDRRPDRIALATQ